jgi:hypothetical protein
MYVASPEDNGVRFEPWPVVQRAWDTPRTLYRYDEVVVVRSSPSGEVAVLDEWPDDLGPLPRGATYAPRARMAPGPLGRARILAF